jgi:hypothetical protein
VERIFYKSFKERFHHKFPCVHVQSSPKISNIFLSARSFLDKRYTGQKVVLSSAV